MMNWRTLDGLTPKNLAASAVVRKSLILDEYTANVESWKPEIDQPSHERVQVRSFVAEGGTVPIGAEPSFALDSAARWAKMVVERKSRDAA